MVDGTIRVFLAEALLLPTGIITAAFLTRRLGPGGYGLFTLAAVIVAWIEWTIASLFSRATVKFISEADDWRMVGATVVRLYLAASSAAALSLWLLAPSIAGMLAEPALADYLRLFALDIPIFSLAHAHRNILIGIGSFKQQSLASASRWMVRLLLIILLVELGLSVSGAILGSIGASLAELAVSRSYVRPPLFRRSSFPARQLWTYAVPLFLCAMSLRLFDKLDLLLLKVLGGTAEQAGIYGAAQNLSLVPGIFALSFSPLLLSTLSRVLRAGDNHLAGEMSRNAMRMVIGLLPFAGMTAGATAEIITLIFGPIFSPAATPLALLIFGALALVMISVCTAILTAAGKPGWTFALTGPLLPLAITGHLLLIPWLGAVGASLVTAVFAGLAALVSVMAVYHVWRVLPPAWTAWRSILICALAYALATVWPAPGVLLILKLSVIGLIICLSFLLLGEFNATEVAVARSLLRWQTVRGQNPT